MQKSNQRWTMRFNFKSKEPKENQKRMHQTSLRLESLRLMITQIFTKLRILVVKRKVLMIKMLILPNPNSKQGQ